MRCWSAGSTAFVLSGYFVDAASDSGRSVIASKGFGCWPNPFRWHVERVGKRLPPGGRFERLAPVIGHPDRLPVSQVRDGDVAVHTTVAVVRAPLHDERVAAGVASTNCEPDALEMGLYFADPLPAVITSPLCGH